MYGVEHKLTEKRYSIAYFYYKRFSFQLRSCCVLVRSLPGRRVETGLSPTRPQLVGGVYYTFEQSVSSLALHFAIVEFQRTIPQ